MATSNQQRSITDFLSSPFDLTKMKPLMTSTPINANNVNRKRKAPESDGNQMILDLGQKNIGMNNCKEVSLSNLTMEYI